jgi:hypothetical protein
MASAWLGLDITPSPAADLVSENDISSVLSSVAEWDILKHQTDSFLLGYKRNDIYDDTDTFINQLLNHLPTEGQIVLMKEIVELGNRFDDFHDKLRQLRNFFVDAILKPSTTQPT